MIKIRRNTFETNSSSTHSISIPKHIEYPTEKRCRILFNLDEFGWEWAEYPLHNYLYTAICSIYGNSLKKDDYVERIKSILSPYFDKIDFETPLYNGDWLENGYIDHCDELEGLLEILYENDELLVNALLNGYVKTGNDNDCSPDDFYTKEYTNEEEYFIYEKGN